MAVFRFFILITSFALSITALADFPKNNLHLLDRLDAPSNVTEEQFNQITDSIVAVWQPLAKLHGAELSAVKNWKDSTVNAYATQSGNKWVIQMFGGLARRPEVTPDGYALVVCHELGHHFGGYYFYDSSLAWAAAEGQADYFATQVCAKRVFAAARRVNHMFRMHVAVPATVKDSCDKAWKESAAQELCYRSSAGGLSLANLLAVLGREPQPAFETPDKSEVGKTNTAHPRAQCRLDTYFQGALCSAPFKLEQIPGKDLGANRNSTEAEKMAAAVSCTKAGGFEQGMRPLCWFKPSMLFSISRH